MQLWVENAKTIKDRMESGNPPENRRWSRQRQAMRVFDVLIYNFDRNQGNMLLDATDKLWFIDHTRSFALSSEVPALDQIVWCERDMWEALKSLDKDTLVDLLTPEVEYARVISMAKRREKIVEHIQGLIDQRGAEVVLYRRRARNRGCPRSSLRVQPKISSLFRASRRPAGKAREVKNI